MNNNKNMGFWKKFLLSVGATTAIGAGGAEIAHKVQENDAAMHERAVAQGKETAQIKHLIREVEVAEKRTAANKSQTTTEPEEVELSPEHILVDHSHPKHKHETPEQELREIKKIADDLNATSEKNEKADQKTVPENRPISLR